ncbi:hypothetical protein [Allokutzneria sp. NRRL B-24872]|uniref:hypothetical protein n=1 Tax=Allokutzneria sp. NRRL B-24872 TaxID=1137961 RepID=UPI000A3766F8|nr:hypothetical protein [Allokutzneria sp. NRRL B-24872]
MRRNALLAVVVAAAVVSAPAVAVASETETSPGISTGAIQDKMVAGLQKAMGLLLNKIHTSMKRGMPLTQDDFNQLMEVRDRLAKKGISPTRESEEKLAMIKADSAEWVRKLLEKMGA